MMSKRTVSLLMTVITAAALLVCSCFGTAAEEVGENLECNTTAAVPELTEENSTAAASSAQGMTTATTAQPTTEPIVPADFPALTVSAVSNLFPNATAEYNIKTNQVEVIFWYKASLDVESVQWSLDYDESILTLSEEKNTPKTICPTIGDKCAFTMEEGRCHYCSSNIKLYNFSKEEKLFARFVFDVVELDPEEPVLTTVDLTVNMLVASALDKEKKISVPENEVILVANEGLNEFGLRDTHVSRRTSLTPSNFVQATTAPPTTAAPVTDASGKVINTPDEPTREASSPTVPDASADATSFTSGKTTSGAATPDGSDPQKGGGKNATPSNPDGGIVNTGAPVYAWICLGILCAATSVLFVMRKKEILYN